jgi:hypothetical protein
MLKMQIESEKRTRDKRQEVFNGQAALPGG